MPVFLRERKLTGKTHKHQVCFYLDLYTNGRRWTEFLHVFAPEKRYDPISYKTVRDACERVRSQREAELLLDANGLENPNRQNVSVTDYFAECIKDKRTSNYNSALNVLKQFTNSLLTFKAITPHWLEAYQTWLLEKFSRNTANIYFCHLKTILNKAVKAGIIRESPMKRADTIVKPEQKLKSFLTLKELEMLAATPCHNETVKDAFLFACFVGLRISDVEKLKWADIEGNQISFRQTKTGTATYLPLNETAAKYLEKQPKDFETCFVMPSRPSIAKVLRDWPKAAGITKAVTFHTSRHTFAVLALSSGTDIYTVSKLLGHRDVKITQVYAAITSDAKSKAAAAMPMLSTKQS
jgi:integrase